MKKPYTPKYKFISLPAIGHCITKSGQKYFLGTTTPYVRSDGQNSFLLDWVTLCKECDSPFCITTGLTFNWLNTRCPLHRRCKQNTIKAKLAKAKYEWKYILMDAS
jgi:hypothetical protein